MTQRLPRLAAGVSLIALIILSLLWEARLAPLRPGGTWLTLKTLPLLFPLAGILSGRIYTYRWSSMLILLYFAEGAVRAWSDRGLAQWLAVGEVALSLAFFAAVLAYIREVKVRGASKFDTAATLQSRWKARG